MKKLLSVFLTILLATVCMSCRKPTESAVNSNSTSSELKTESTVTVKEEQDLQQMLDTITKGTDLPQTSVFVLDKSNFEAYSFMPWEEGIESVCQEGMMTTTAHSLVLLKTNPDKAEEWAKAIAKKANPLKWICVGAESSQVLYTKEYILLAMTYDSEMPTIEKNFKALVGQEVQSITIEAKE